MVVTPSATVAVYRHAIIALAARHKLPAVYGFRLNVTAGGLISYGPDRVDLFRPPVVQLAGVRIPATAPATPPPLKSSIGICRSFGRNSGRSVVVEQSAWSNVYLK
ncbi:MAG: hypothetical protein WCB74_22170 [Pseudolabrys sp.]|jgi:hypothetical protein